MKDTYITIIIGSSHDNVKGHRSNKFLETYFEGLVSEKRYLRIELTWEQRHKLVPTPGLLDRWGKNGTKNFEDSKYFLIGFLKPST